MALPVLFDQACVDLDLLGVLSITFATCDLMKSTPAGLPGTESVEFGQELACSRSINGKWCSGALAAKQHGDSEATRVVRA